MAHSRVLLALPLVAVALSLSACSLGSPGSVASAGSSGASGASAGSASSAAAAPAGSVSTDGVCGLVPISKVNSILKRRYTDSKEIPIPDISIADAAYCLYGTATAAGEFAIQVVTSDPSTAIERFSDATGDTLVAQSGIGDSAMFSASYPELLVVWGQTTVVVGQDGSEKGDAQLTLAQLEKLATTVHAAG
jgi:hypothetical protein